VGLTLNLSVLHLTTTRIANLYLRAYI